MLNKALRTVSNTRHEKSELLQYKAILLRIKLKTKTNQVFFPSLGENLIKHNGSCQTN